MREGTWEELGRRVTGIKTHWMKTSKDKILQGGWKKVKMKEEAEKGGAHSLK